jgi:hypothetical protein
MYPNKRKAFENQLLWKIKGGERMSIVQIIEKLRNELVELGTIRGLQDPEVIRLSQKLDEYINDYYYLRKRPLIKIGYKTKYKRRTRPCGGFLHLKSANG